METHEKVTEPTISIVYQHQDFVVLNKPAGINFHDEGQIGTGLFSQVKNQLNLPELFPVHRLDKMTSGLVIFATNLAATRWFQLTFEQHNIEKFYLAISDKKPSKKQGLVKGDMEKSRRGSWKLMRSVKNPAITQFFSFGLGNKQRLYILKPHSGRTHQIRVAMNSLGAPILGDERYGSVDQEQDRGYLHAYALRFTYQGEPIELVSPPNSGVHFIAESCQKQLNQLEQPSNLAWPRVK